MFILCISFRICLLNILVRMRQLVACFIISHLEFELAREHCICLILLNVLSFYWPTQRSLLCSWSSASCVRIWYDTRLSQPIIQSNWSVRLHLHFFIGLIRVIVFPTECHFDTWAWTIAETHRWKQSRGSTIGQKSRWLNNYLHCFIPPLPVIWNLVLLFSSYYAVWPLIQGHQSGYTQKWEDRNFSFSANDVVSRWNG